LIVPGYCAGVMAAGCLYSLIALMFFTRHTTDTFERLLYGIVLPLVLAFTTLLPGVFFLGITLWLKHKIVREVRFSGYRAAFFWGLVAGLYPYPLFPAYQNAIGPVDNLLWFVFLGWLVFYPVAVGLFLCRHSHLRE
jgi:hypothetical protein